MWDPSCICNLHHRSRQCQIPDPLSQASDQTRILMDSSWIRFHTPWRELLEIIWLLNYKSKCIGSGSSLVAQWFRIWCCHCSNLGRSCGKGLIPGLGTSVCCWHGQKKKKKKRKRKRKKMHWLCASKSVHCFLPPLLRILLRNIKTIAFKKLIVKWRSQTNKIAVFLHNML